MSEERAAKKDPLPWGLVIVACLTLGLAPFAPPHVVEKLRMLFAGTLERPIDIFDLLMHGAPWGLLLVKLGVELRRRLGRGSG